MVLTIDEASITPRINPTARDNVVCGDFLTLYKHKNRLKRILMV